MYAKEHLAIHSLVAVILTLICFFIFKVSILQILNINVLLAVGLYFLGAILPDADSNNKGSKIYYQEGLNLLAHIVSWLEYPIAKFVTKREIGHRQSLHTIFGILITSIFVAIIATLLYNFIYHSYSLIWFFVWFISLFIGQYLHLVEDKIKNWEWKICLK
jgi:membrane-bound metal-dependent hydrolase YbcI (DUF457 family)